MTYQDTSQEKLRASVRESLQSISIGSYLFQTELAAKLGLYPTDLRAIHILSLNREGLAAGGLGDQIGLTSGSTTVLIDRLVEAGYAKREADPDDGRRVRVVLTRAGEAELRSHYGEIRQRVTNALSELDGGEVAAVATFLSRIAGRT